MSTSPTTSTAAAAAAGGGASPSPSQAGLALGKQVQKLMSDSNEVRRPAEKEFNAMLRRNPQACLQGLLEVLTLAPDPAARKLAITLVRGNLFGEESNVLPDDGGLWEVPLPKPFKDYVKQALLKTLAQERDSSVCRVATTVTATIGMAELQDGAWPELLPFIAKGTTTQLVAGGNFQLAENCFEMFALLGYYLAETQLQQLPAFRGMFEGALAKAPAFGRPGARVVGAAVKALGQLMVCLPKAEHVEVFQDLVPGVLTALMHVVKHKLQAESMQILSILAEVAEEYARFFKPHLDQFLTVMAQIGASDFVQEFEPKIRHIAVEVIVLLAERAPVMARRMPGNKFVLTALQSVLKLMMDQEDDPEWAVRDDEEDDDMDDDGGDVGCQAIERLARAIRAKHFIGPALVAVRKWSTNPDWRCRSAAYLALSQLGEILPADTEEQKKLVLYILKAFVDPNAHVRYAAVHCVGQLSIDLAPTMQMDTHNEVFAASAHVMGDFKAPRVQAHLLGALANFIDHCSENVLASHTEKLLKQLAAVLQHGRLPVQAQAITTLASVADRVSKSFQKYYASFAPVLKSVLVNPKVDSKTRGRTLECLTLIGEAVGRGMFRADALTLMDLMVRLNSKEDPMLMSYIWAAWNRICVALGPDDFARYLPLVVPTLLKHVSQPAKTSIHDVDADDEDALDDYNMVAGGTAVVNSLALEDQATAARVLSSLVRTMGAGYRDYINETVAKMVPLTVEAYFDDVKYACIGALPSLINAALLCAGGSSGGGAAAMAHVRGIVDFIVKTLLKGLAEELTKRPGGDDFDINIHFGYITGMKRCLEAANGGSRILAEGKPPKTSLTLLQLEALVQMLMRSLQASFQRCAVIVAEGRVEERDEDALEVAAGNMKEEHALQFELVDTLGHCLGIHPDLFMQHIYPKYVLPKIDEFSGEHRTSNDRKLAYYLIDDLIECSAGLWLPHFEKYLRLLVAGVRDSDYTTRQAALYGLGVAAQHSPSVKFQTVMPAVLALLQRTIAAPDARADDNEIATDNAVSALGKILDTHNQPQLVRPWLSYMPLRGDLNESKEVLLHLLKLVQSKPALLLGGAGGGGGAGVGAGAGVAGAAGGLDEGNVALVVRALVLYLQLPKVASEEAIGKVRAVLQGLRRKLQSTGRDAAVLRLLQPPEVAEAFKSI